MSQSNKYKLTSQACQSKFNYYSAYSNFLLWEVNTYLHNTFGVQWDC